MMGAYRTYGLTCFDPRRQKIGCMQFSFPFDHSGWKIASDFHPRERKNYLNDVKQSSYILAIFALFPGSSMANYHIRVLHLALS